MVARDSRHNNEHSLCAMCQDLAKRFTCIISFIWHKHSREGQAVIPIFQMRKMKLREVKELA